MRPQEKRQKRIHALKNHIKENEPINFDKLIAEISLDLSVTKRKAKDYLETLETAERIEVDDEGMVEYVGDEDE